jgi:predicted transcriptional regulator
MRTTINIDDHLLQEAKEVALRTHRSLSEIVEEGMRIFLQKRKSKKTTKKVSLVTFGEGGLQPGVDLDDSAALLGIMERTDDPF